MLACQQRPARGYWLSPPCGPDSQIQNLNQGRFSEQGLADHKHKKDRAHRIQKNCKKIIKDILSSQPFATIVLEQPRGCRSIGQAGNFYELKEQLHVTETSGCFWGMRDESTGLLMDKRWKIVTNNPSLAKAFAGTTCQGGHVHQPIVGGVRVALTASYPRAMCKMLTRWMLRLPSMEPSFGQLFGAAGDPTSVEMQA